MEFSRENADLFIPDSRAEDPAMARVTHLGIGAHQDDLEFMAFHGIISCHERNDQWFGGITLTDGAGSARSGVYSQYSDAEMIAARWREQRRAAEIGKYGFMAQLGHTSGEVQRVDHTVVHDISQILQASQPRVIYTHNPADKHDTHVAVFAATLKAIRAMPVHHRPDRLLGCEMWRDLDWMLDKDKVVLDLSGHDSLASTMHGVFLSQISGGKRYDQAVMGRRKANATLLNTHATDSMTSAWFAMDLTPLIQDDKLTPAELVNQYLDGFTSDVRRQLSRYHR